MDTNQTPQPPPVLQDLNVLLIDDEPLVLRSVQRLLRGLGARSVEIASTIDAAIGTCAQGRIDVAVIDVWLGAVHGLDVAVAVRSVVAGLPVVFMSGNPHPDFDAPFVQKPIDEEKLTRVLRDVLR